MRRAFKALLLACCSLLLCGAAQAAGESWWNENWTCRKTVQVTPVGQFNQDLAAVTAFTTGGHLMSGAADLRILDGYGREIPYYVVASDFDDLCVVAYPVQRADEILYFYYGNPDALRPRYDWRPRRGLILEVRTMGRGSVNNWRQMYELIENSREVQGRGLHNCVFDGHNRFGPSDNYISIYRGYLYCPQSGKYGFATTSDDASFLFVDSKLVVQWPGHHGAVADARHNVTTELNHGVHLFEYYHADVGGAQVAEAAWRPPGQEAFAVIPPEAFVPFWWGSVIDYEKHDDPKPVDFSSWQESSLPCEDFLFSAVRFNIDFPASTSLNAREWDFGDGITSTERSPVHVYARPGKWRVELTVGDKELAQTVRVWENERVSDFSENEAVAQYTRIFKSYDLSAMSAADVLPICRFARVYDAADLEYDALAALSELRDSYRHKAAGEALLEHANALWLMGHYDVALDLFGELGSRHAEKDVSLTALYRRGQRLLALERHAEALEVFERLETKSLAHPKFRALALIGKGDYYRAKGDAKAARESYIEAVEGAEAPGGGGALAQGAYAQAALEYLHAGEFEAALEQIDTWERTVPVNKLDGYFSLLKTTALIKFGDGVRANAEARDQHAANPEGNYAPHMLLLQGDCLALWKQEEKAKEKYLKLVEDYPESPLRSVAEYRTQNPPKTVDEIRFPVLDF